MTNPAPPPGWYPDPAGTSQSRYWDGTTWVFDAAYSQTPPTQTLRMPPEADFATVHNPPRGSAWRTAGLIAAAIALTAGLIVAIIVGSAATDEQTAATTTPTSAAPTPPADRPSSSRPAPTTSADQRAALRDWGQDALPEINALQSSFEDIAETAGNGDIPGMSAACLDLAASVSDLREKLPTPDRAVTRELTAALDHYAAGATVCSLADTGNITETQLMDAAEEISAGNERLVAATGLIKQRAG